MICNEGYATEAQPHYIERAEGCYLWDRSGHRMIDMALGGGSMILGHAHPVVVDAVRAQISRGSIFTAPHAGLHEMDELLDRFIPWLPGRVWCNSGSEAVMRLCRIARAVTGKPKIGLFSGCWHGSWDGTLVEERYEAIGCNGTVAMKPRSSGLPEGVLGSVLFLPYRDSAALSLIREHASELSCVLVELVQGSCPSDEVGRFLADLRHTCTDCGVLLACDEVITGFRLAPGGGQEYFSIQADLAAYGKVLGGGLPIGMVSGRADIMDEARQREVFFGGTFSGNPLTVAAGCATLSWLSGGSPTPVYPPLNEAGSLLRAAVNDKCRRRGLPVHMMGTGSISRLIHSPAPITTRRARDLAEPSAAAQIPYYQGVRERGVHVGSNRIQFLSTAHGISELGQVVEALCQ